MACLTCGKGEWKLGVCRCCELVDGDKRSHLVRLCSTCNVDLCRQCFKITPRAIARRILAFGLDLVSN